MHGTETVVWLFNHFEVPLIASLSLSHPKCSCASKAIHGCPGKYSQRWVDIFLTVSGCSKWHSWNRLLSTLNQQLPVKYSADMWLIKAALHPSLFLHLWFFSNLKCSIWACSAVLPCRYCYELFSEQKSADCRKSFSKLAISSYHLVSTAIMHSGCVHLSLLVALLDTLGLAVPNVG